MYCREVIRWCYFDVLLLRWNLERWIITYKENIANERILPQVIRSLALFLQLIWLVRFCDAKIITIKVFRCLKLTLSSKKEKKIKAYLRYIFAFGFLRCELVVVLTLSDHHTAIMFLIKRKFLKFTDFIIGVKSCN